MGPIELVKIGLVRDASNPDDKTTAISTPTDALPYLEDIKTADREHFICLHLSARNTVNSLETVSIGSLNAALVHPREIFKAAILSNAASIIIAHNHPSGDVTPSSEDCELTRRLKQAGELLGIELLDHLIVGPERYLSMKEAGCF